jgi:hypothetical protein
MLALALGTTGAAATPPSTPPPATFVANGPVHALVESQGRLYVGGDFTRVGPRTGSGAIFDHVGARRRFPEVAGGEVRAVISDQAGGWYVGGTFTHVDGVPRDGVAHVREDGSLDPDFDPEIVNDAGSPVAVNAIAYSHHTDPAARAIYLGGDFVTVGQELHRGLAAVRPDGGVITSWIPRVACLSTSNDPCRSRAVRSLLLTHLPLTVNGSTAQVPVVVAGGDFNRVTDSETLMSAKGVAAIWGVGAADSAVPASEIGGTLVMAGTSPWAPAVTGSGVAPRVRSLAVQVHPSSATAAVYIGGEGSSLLATTPILAAYQLLISSPTSRTASSATKFAKWVTAASAPDGAVHAVAFDRAGSPARLHVGGAFRKLGTATTARHVASVPVLTNLATTNPPGPSIEALPWGPGLDGPARALAVSPSGTVFAGGDFEEGVLALDSSGVRMETWRAPTPDSPVLALAADAAAVYAGGAFASLDSQPRAGLASFDSTGELRPWRPGVASTQAGTPPLVRSLAASAGIVYVGGRFDAIDVPGRRVERANLAALDAESGDVAASFDVPVSLSSGSPGVLALATGGSWLYVGGGFGAVGGQPRLNLARVNALTGEASTWAPAAEPGPVHAILPACGGVYVGGHLTHVAGQPRLHLAAVDTASGAPTSWAPDADGAVLALSRFGQTIYAGGNFARIGGENRYGAAALSLTDARATAFDAGADGPVRAIAATDAAVYVGGTFGAVGGTALQNLAALDPGSGNALAWNPLADGSVRALALSGGALHVGGDFEATGAAAQSALGVFAPGAGSAFSESRCAEAVPESVGDDLTTAVSPGGAAPPAAEARPRPTTAPPLTSLSVTPRLLRAGRPLSITFRLRRSALVTLRFERLERCRPRRGARRSRCREYRRFAELRRRGRVGTNRIAVRRRVGARKLTPGAYRVSIASSAGGPAPPIRHFRVVGRGVS